MKSWIRVTIAAIFISGIACATAQAYEQQLSTEKIREAYFLGSRNDEITADFWNHYSRKFPPSGTSLHVGAVEILTPYAQVVFAAQHDMVNENSVDAVQEYRGRSLPFVVRVYVDFPTGYIGTSIYDSAAEAVVVVFDSHQLSPRATTRHSVYVGSGRYRSVAGVKIEQRFDTVQVSSGELTVRVTFQDGRHFETVFDLARMN